VNRQVLANVAGMAGGASPTNEETVRGWTKKQSTGHGRMRMFQSSRFSAWLRMASLRDVLYKRW